MSCIKSAARTAFLHVVAADFAPNAEGGEHAVTDIFVDDPAIVEHRFGDGREMVVQHVHDIVGQIALGESREIPDVREQDSRLNFFSFAWPGSMQFVEIQDNNILRIADEETDSDVAMNLRLATKAGELVPPSSRRNLLLPFVRSGNPRNPVQNLHAARRATRLAAALVMMGDSLSN